MRPSGVADLGVIPRRAAGRGLFPRGRPASRDRRPGAGVPEDVND